MRWPLWLALLISTASSSFAAPLTKIDERRVRIREVFGLHAPYLIVNWEGYLDGGSSSGYIKDSEGNTLKFSIARHVRAIPVVRSAERMRAMADSILAIPTDLYIGHYQSNPDAEKLELGSEREKALLDLLELAAVDELGTSRIAHLDSVLATANEPSARSKFYADASVFYRVYQIATGLRKQRQQHVVGWDDE